ncbi:MAG: Crp/Fnr family transcriptional regulator [Desulfatitalea sp.]|nr:Crp/Fnr family transcriptional regulator [Desulfatitalea sp.]NNK00528.1 Crp/Fnr family transcriptional regulator [Desulfatitalea sp.]
MRPKRDTIAESPMFAGLSKDQLDQLEGIGREVALKRGETIFREDDEGNGFYIVAAGKVKIYKVSAEGKEQILHIYGPGQPFGEVPVFAGKHFPANAQAVDGSRLIFFPRRAFIDLITANPSLAMNMLAVLSMRLRQFTVQIENLSLKEVPGRLASYLLVLSEEQAGPDVVRLPISKGQLASLLGTIPETLSRIFNKMSAQGYIEVNGSAITLLDRPALDDLSVTGRLVD